MSRPSVTLPRNGSKPRRSQLTVMFFFAGDNNLAPSMISQLKALKDAGYQKRTTVVARYDPNEMGARTRIFKVNECEKVYRMKKGEGTRIGDSEDSYVRNLRSDEYFEDGEAPASRNGGKPRKKSDSVKACDALKSFLNTCRREAPADHYILFLIGHGMIVGTDAFLPDDYPNTAISLAQLGSILRQFTRNVEKDKGVFDLVGMHSCSMSSIEVAYELWDTARYMMATEGISFVGSWPYRQLLKKIFNTVEKADGRLDTDDMNLLLEKLYQHTYYNSTDFMFAGFSADLVLCNLNKEVVRSFDRPLAELTSALRASLKAPCGAQLVLLSHWKSQSYWQENYTDLYDFCRCLNEYLAEGYVLCRCPAQKCDPDGALQKRIMDACGGVMKKLDPDACAGRKPPEWLTEAEREQRFRERLVVFSTQFGPTYQYSHGLSVYFPWSRPIDDGINDVIEKYRAYKFTRALGGGAKSADSPRNNSWLRFLTEYFTETMRKRRDVEDALGPKSYDVVGAGKGAGVAVTTANVLLPGAPSGGSASDSLPGGPNGKSSPSLTGKTSPSDSGGVGCGCPSIKNYPPEFVMPPALEGSTNGRRRRRR